MITLNTEQLDKIKTHTLTCYPEECCGVITDIDFFPIKNIAPEPKGAFQMDKDIYNDYVKNNNVIGIYHSHIREFGVNYGYISKFDLRTPSPRDVLSQKAMGIPFLIGGTDGETFELPIEYPQDQNTSLHGRPFMFYLNDCFTLMRDYYFQTYGINIKPHHESFDWINKGEGIVYPFYDAFMEEWGFHEIPIEEAEEGDVVIMSVRGTANHMGVLVGDNRILHHMIGQLSGSESRARIQSYVHKYLRHKDKNSNHE